MVIEETRDLAETADCVVIEAILVDDGLRYKQLSVGIKDESGDIIRIVPISTVLIQKEAEQCETARLSFCKKDVLQY